MLKHFPIYIIILCACAHVMLSCAEEESWTSDASARLEFSVDSVVFDTLLSTVPSATRTLTVYNRNADGVRLPLVRLLQGGESHFRVNVDGQYLAGGVGEDFEIRGRDSLMVRVEVTLPRTGSVGPVGFEDRLDFQLASGVVQGVVLTAGAQDALFMRGRVIGADTVLASALPIVVYDSLVVGEGATLTLAPGTTLMFHDRASLQVRGTLLSLGSLERPVTLRGDRTDRMFPYLPYDNTPSRWEGVHLHASSRGNRLSYTDLHSGRYGIVCDSTGLDGEPMLEMDGCVIHNIGGDGLQLNNCRATIRNTQVSNTQGRCVSLFGGAYRFEFCTLAQFYPFTAERGEALYVSNLEGDNFRHLAEAHFLSCVITGYGDDVIMGSISEGQDEAVNYLFSHCFLNTVESDDEMRFVEVRYDHLPQGEEAKDDEEQLLREKNFKLFDTENFLYDFTPDSLSLIRNMADTALARRLPFDRLGRSRLADEAPDAGCLEYMP